MIDKSKFSGMNYYYRNYPIEYFFQSLKENEIENFELWTCTHHFEIDNLHYQNVKDFKKKFVSNELNIICLTPEQSNPKPYSLAAKTPELINKARNYFKNAIDAANELESPIVSMNSGWDFYSENPSEAWKRSTDLMRELVEYAELRGVKMTLEALQPEESHLVNTINELVAYLKVVDHPNLFINLDLGAMARSHETINQYFETFKERIIHCHFVDGNPTGHLAWGDGTRNMESDLREFEKNSYQGYFTFEFANSTYFLNPKAVDKNVMNAIKKINRRNENE
ncbi:MULTISPECIES: sugar phosphate isomerase/epimerase family protein [Enterococcus]|uniref:sugar phosphate isomerase/epimerase family protein n=1 Tax=Enterococcus TaxID=1350 RepID=UPI0010F786E3|nr:MULTISPECIES: TIM barrel protein [Enterococcus]KAF1300591.1 hypothetical protein BAU16_12385 [Enterococcus sp. JM9B]